MAVYTETMFEARKDYGAIFEGEYLELVLEEDRDYLMSESGEFFEIRVDAFDDNVLFLAENPKVKFDKVECVK